MDISYFKIGTEVHFMFLGSEIMGTVTKIMVKENKVQVIDEDGTYHQVGMTKDQSKFCYFKNK